VRVPHTAVVELHMRIQGVADDADELAVNAYVTHTHPYVLPTAVRVTHPAVIRLHVAGSC
jgi:hypothetical protein